ncbi:MAG: ABC transporter ATP-binding protein [Microbacterium sp.]
MIEVEQMSKSYRGRFLYKDASFTIEKGQVTAVSGPNGSGKSVLFRLLCGFLAPDSGVVRIDPAYLSKGRDFPERFGVVIDRPAYLAGKTGMDNLRELAAIRGVISDDDIRSTMRRVGLDPELRQKVRHYSLGMKQKLALAQAFMENPDVLILDEPFNALDADSALCVKEIIRELNAAGVTVVFTSHNATDVDDLASRRLVIANEMITAA